MRWVRYGLLAAAAAALLLAGCESDPGDRPQEYQIDQDINASHGADTPTMSNQGAPGFETWRYKDPDTFGHPSGR